VLNRGHEDALEACEDYGIGFIPYFPIAAGSISDVDTIQEVTDAHGATVYQIALAWLLKHSDVMLQSQALEVSNISRKTSLLPLFHS